MYLMISSICRVLRGMNRNLPHIYTSSYVYSNSFFPRKYCKSMQNVQLMLVPKDLRMQIIRKKAHPHDDWA